MFKIKNVFGFLEDFRRNFEGNWMCHYLDKIFYFGYFFKKTNLESKPWERRTLWICPNAESVSTGAITRQPMCTVQNHHSGFFRATLCGLCRRM